MSHYNEIETQITDETCLVDALKEEFKEVQVNTAATNLEGYQGDKRSQKAEIVIPRKYVGGASNDIGFAKQANGTYKAIISDYDRGRYGDTWLNRLKQKYAEKKTARIAAKQGYKLVGKKEVKTSKGNKIQLIYSAGR